MPLEPLLIMINENFDENIAGGGEEGCHNTWVILQRNTPAEMTHDY